jgi:hypothetical protein
MDIIPRPYLKQNLTISYTKVKAVKAHSDNYFNDKMNTLAKSHPFSGSFYSPDLSPFGFLDFFTQNPDKILIPKCHPKIS